MESLAPAELRYLIMTLDKEIGLCQDAISEGKETVVANGKSTNIRELREVLTNLRNKLIRILGV